MHKLNNYRLKFIRKFPGIRLPGYPGYWYKCASCGRWIARPGISGLGQIPENLKMEVDHIVPWSKGGTDNLDNLQPMCKICNRNKGNSMDAIDMQIAMNNAARKGKQLNFIKRRKKRSQYKSQRY